MKIFEQKTQNKLIDLLFAVYVVFAALYLAIPIFKIYKLNWQLNDTLGSILLLFALVGFILRNKITLNIKANIFVVILLLSGFREEIYVDSYKGYLVLMLSLVVASYFLKGKTVLFYLVTTIIISSTISVFRHSDMFSSLVQISELEANFYWIEQIVLFSILTGVFIWSLVNFRKSIISALSHSEQETVKYRPLFEQSYSFVYVLDFNGNIIEANQAALFYIHKKIDDIKGQYFPNTLWWKHSEVAQMKIENALEACKNGDFRRFETTHKNIDNALEYFDYTLKPIFDEEFNIQYIIAEGRDITKAKLAEQALREGEERLIALTESTYEGLIITYNGILVEANKAALDMFKIGKIEDVFGMDLISLLVHPDDAPLIAEKIKYPYSSPYEIRAVLATGEVIQIEMQGRDIIYKGKPHRISAIRDLTDRKKAQKALVESEEKYRLITENINDIICKLDKNLKFTFVSSSVLNILGYAVDEVYSKSLKDLTTEDSYKTILGHFRKKNEYIIEGNERAWTNSAFEAVLVHKNGSLLSMHLNAKLVQLSSDNSYEILCVARNIEDIKQIQVSLEISKNQLKQQNEEYERLNRELKTLNKELILAKNKAEESDKLKSAFLSNMSHEIRTPLNSIIGFSRMYQRDDLDEEKRKKYAGFVISNGLQLLGIVNDILDLSKIESDQIRLKSEEVNINLLMDMVYSNFQESNNKALLCTVHKEMPDSCIVVTDSNRLYQVLQNLTNNAYKFTKKGSVNIGYKIVNNNILFFIEDTGIGISPENQDKIFERFRQVEMETSRVFGGAGLGLSISKKLVELMGGKIWVKSKPGEGSTFYFSIPYTTPVRKIVNSNAPILHKKETTIDHFNTILVAEDDVSNFAYISELLIESEFKIIWVKNGADAVDKCLTNNDIDLVLMDIKMPTMDGLEATRRIKQQKPNLPIIAQTAFAMADDKENAMKSGCDDYLSKPIDPINLMSKIRHYL